MIPPNPSPQPKLLGRFNRERLAECLGVGHQRKFEVYRDLSEAATLRDLSYWMQVLAAAGIGTLGLILNSPAVIIGAMLISPLMGPILSLGMGLAAGNLILIVRAVANLALSCLVAIALSMVSSALLPFRELTPEIASRTQPNILDLVVALVSGAIGTLSTCRPMTGVVTSIPGVAIAVALMPPLCVVGYGLGLSVTFSSAVGLATAGGGGYCFSPTWWPSPLPPCWCFCRSISIQRRCWRRWKSGMPPIRKRPGANVFLIATPGDGVCGEWGVHRDEF
ncbi:MAG: DUF389 domain-containing protein [Oscillatoriales cyanobacterium SM2_2_1]|nr:DUF389 domain-containing protein [Oscillatoriales cyanobacterium SM2_2_1]